MFPHPAGLGRPGQWVWQVAAAIEDLRAREAHLLQAVAWLRAKARDPQYLLPPVDFRTFLEELAS